MKSNILSSTGFVLMTSLLYVAVGAQRLGAELPHQILDLNLTSNWSCVGELDEHSASKVGTSPFFFNITAGSDPPDCIALFDGRLCSGHGLSLQFHNISNQNLLIERYNPALQVFYISNYILAFRSIQQCPPDEDLDGIEGQSWRNRYCETGFQVEFGILGTYPSLDIQSIYTPADSCINLLTKDKEEQLAPNAEIYLTVGRDSREGDVCLELYTDIQCEGDMFRLMIPGVDATREDPFIVWGYVLDAHERPLIHTDIRSIRKCGPCLDSDSPDQTESIIIYVGVGILLLFLTSLAMWALRFRIRKAFKHQSPTQPITAVTLKTQQTNSYEIARDAFTIDVESCLGSGAFGKVCRGKMRTCSVYYVNVDLETGNAILSDVKNGGLDATIGSDLLRWSMEIPNGLEFLAKQRIVHMDIATRNVLLSSDKRAKITDFGLSRRLYDYQSYLKKQQEPLPWRWMAPESLRRLEFTEKSDVWAFGITLWEIFTLGDEPYAGLAWDVNFSDKLENGLKLGEPKYNLNNVYSTMCRCFDMNPASRPTFSDLSILLVQNSICSGWKTFSTIINP